MWAALFVLCGAAPAAAQGAGSTPSPIDRSYSGGTLGLVSGGGLITSNLEPGVPSAAPKSTVARRESAENPTERPARAKQNNRREAEKGYRRNGGFDAFASRRRSIGRD